MSSYYYYGEPGDCSVLSELSFAGLLGTGAVFFLLGVAVAIIWLIVRLRKIKTKNAMKWYFFGISLVLFIL
jgi:hypothetical protein